MGRRKATKLRTIASHLEAAGEEKRAPPRQQLECPRQAQLVDVWEGQGLTRRHQHLARSGWGVTPAALSMCSTHDFAVDDVM